MRGLDHSTFKRRMKGIVDVCGLAQVLGKDIRDLSHGYRQRVGLGQALVHDPPILILDEPTSDLDPNEKAEVIKYIKEIGKERTILLSTHNLSEVEAACARAIIVSKGRVVADGPLDEIRSRSGKVRYVVTVHEQKVLRGRRGLPLRRARRRRPRRRCRTRSRPCPASPASPSCPTDDKAHRFQMMGAARRPTSAPRSSRSWSRRAGCSSRCAATRRRSRTCSRPSPRATSARTAAASCSTKTTRTRRTRTRPRRPRPRPPRRDERRVGRRGRRGRRRRRRRGRRGRGRRRRGSGRRRRRPTRRGRREADEEARGEEEGLTG